MSTDTINTEPFLEAAFEIGVDLCRRAYWHESQCTWMGPTRKIHNGEWVDTYGTLNCTLFDGIAGPAWFLSSLAKATGEETVLRTATAAMRQMTAKFESVPTHARAAFYTGQSGVITTLLHHAVIHQDTWAKETAFSLLKELADLKYETQDCDLIEGVAGAIVLLIKAHALFAEDSLLQAAIYAGDSLLAAGQICARGLSWKTRVNVSPHNLCGFSHGGSGIAWPLIELFHHTQDERYRIAATEALNYEDSWYRPNSQTWVDLRYDPTEYGEMPSPLTWAHGAGGIALGRSLIARRHSSDGLQQYIDVSIKAILEATRQPSDHLSLCHGLTGLLDILMLCETLGQGSYRQHCLEYSDVFLKKYQTRKGIWPSSCPGDFHYTQSIMMGPTGIGQYFLRLHSPDAFPSPLALL